MSRNPFKQSTEKPIKEKALAIYKSSGLGCRKVSKLLREEGIIRSHMWVHRVIKEAAVR